MSPSALILFITPPTDKHPSEEAVEFNELDIFLRRNEEWQEIDGDKPMLEAKPVGVPGAYEPLQMFPKHAPSRSPSPSPLKVREREQGELDVSDSLGEFGLEGVSVSEDDLRKLVEELGLGGDEANDLVKGLAGDIAADAKPAKEDGKKKPEDAKPTAEAPEIKVEVEELKAVPKVEVKVKTEDKKTAETEAAEKPAAP